MKNFLLWALVNFGFAASVWYGVAENVEGALYLAKFFVWAIALPLGFLALTEAMQKKLAEQPDKPMLRLLSNVIAWFALLVFVWHGHVWTGLAWGFRMLATAIARTGSKRYREEATCKV